MAENQKKNKGGRPTVITQEEVRKLQAAFCMGCSNDEACFFAGVKRSTFYDFCKNHPEFSEQITLWKKNPILKAKKLIFDNLEKDLKTARWYLERKCRDEFYLQNGNVSDNSTDTKEAYLESLKNMNNAD